VKKHKEQPLNAANGKGCAIVEPPKKRGKSCRKTSGIICLILDRTARDAHALQYNHIDKKKKEEKSERVKHKRRGFGTF